MDERPKDITQLTPLQRELLVHRLNERQKKAARENQTQRLAAQSKPLPLLSSLVELQPLGDKPPLFCVHARMGGVSSYHSLARHLGTARRFYGLQAKGLDGNEEPYSRVEDIAAHYVRAIRSVQKEGPYAIAGWSFGGLVAFEMAHQLTARGEAVGLVALLDTYAESAESFAALDSSEIVSEMLAHFNISSDRIGPVEKDGDLDHLWSVLQKEGKVPAGIGSDLFRGYVKVSQANHAARRGYELRAYSGKITLFQAAEEREESLLEERQRWEQLAESVEAHVLRCTHNEIFNIPHVCTLAQHLNESLLKSGM